MVYPRDLLVIRQVVEELQCIRDVFVHSQRHSIEDERESGYVGVTAEFGKNPTLRNSTDECRELLKKCLIEPEKRW